MNRWTWALVKAIALGAGIGAAIGALTIVPLGLVVLASIKSPFIGVEFLMIVAALYGTVVGAIVVPLATMPCGVSITKAVGLHAIAFGTIGGWIGSALVLLQNKGADQVFQWGDVPGIPNPIVLAFAMVGLLLGVALSRHSGFVARK